MIKSNEGIMNLPRGITGSGLAKALFKLGYHVTRQGDSHIRLFTVESDEHHVPNALRIVPLLAVRVISAL